MKVARRGFASSTHSAVKNLGQQKFVRDAAELEVERFAAKARPCPHCRRLGTVNAHGFLRGYSESGEFGMTRGRRFFCSNRELQRGCGRTFSILIRRFVKRFVVTAVTIAGFIIAVLAGASIAAAWLVVAQRFSRTSGFRMWRRVAGAQHHLRSLLLGRGPPPTSKAVRPLVQLIEHMRMHVDAPGEALFAALQFEFQVGLFG